MGLTRRDFFTLGMGAAAAIPLTPMPWKLLDDTAKWSQNWSWIPRPPRGERTIRYTTCTLCPSGCGMLARCAGKNLIGIAPVGGHPVSKGVLCPYAFGAHQLPYHRARLTQSLHNGSPSALDKILSAICRRLRTGSFAILDERPGRAVSAAYQKLAAAHDGLYVAADRSESTTLQYVASNTGWNAAGLGMDFENVRTLVSFGAPVLESWATPGRILTLWKERRLAIVQVEADLSKTAALSSRWVPSVGGRPVMETAGLDAALRFARDRGPMLAVSGGGFPASDEREIAALNEGSCGIVRRSGPPNCNAKRLDSVANGSIDILFVDHGPLGGAVAYDELRKKLRRNGVVVSLSPYRAGVAALAEYVIPAPAFGESVDEAPTSWDAAIPSYAVTSALLEPPVGVIHPLDLINRATGGEVTPETAIRGKVEALHAGKRGEVFTFADRTRKPVTQFKSADELWKAFTAGACWFDEGARPVAVACNPREMHAGPVLVASRRPVIAPPLFCKLDQESRIGRPRNG